MLQLTMKYQSGKGVHTIFYCRQHRFTYTNHSNDQRRGFKKGAQGVFENK